MCRHVLRSFAASKQQLLLQLNSHLGEEDRADFVLVEYIMADALHARGIIKAIMPVVVNELADGTHHEAFFQDGLTPRNATGLAVTTLQM